MKQHTVFKQGFLLVLMAASSALHADVAGKISTQKNDTEKHTVGYYWSSDLKPVYPVILPRRPGDPIITGRRNAANRNALEVLRAKLTYMKQ